MGRLDSPLRDRVIFVEGAPRSGTTWLAHLLAAHPQIAGVAAESHLFDYGVDHLFDNFDGRGPIGPGLRGYVERDELADLVRELCDGVLMTMRSHVPGNEAATFVMEKTPTGRDPDGLDLARKAECYPDAWCVHIVRDREAVIRSLMRSPFMSDRSYAVCADARDRAVDQIRQHFGARARYREIHYEDLRSDPRASAHELFDWLGIRTDEQIARTVEVLSRERFSEVGAIGGPTDRARRASLRQAPRLVLREVRRVATQLVTRVDGSPDPVVDTLAFSFVRALRERDEAGLEALTHDALELIVRKADGDVLIRGDPAREELGRLSHKLFNRKWVSESWASSGGGPSEWWTPAAGHPFCSVFVSALGGEAERLDLAFGLTLEGERIRRVLLVSAGPLDGRPSLAD